MTETARPRGTPTITPDCQNGVGVPFTPRFPRSLRPESLWTPCYLRPESLCVLRVLCGQNPSVFSMFSAVDSLRVLGVLPADHPSHKYDLLDQHDLLLHLARHLGDAVPADEQVGLGPRRHLPGQVDARL